VNLILIIADSLRADYVGCYGNKWIKTPNIDRLAEESVLFERAFPEGLPTIPVRRAIYTGNRTWPFKDYQPKKGDTVRHYGWQPMAESDIALAEILKSAGYYTGLISDAYHIFKPAMNFHRGFDTFLWIRGQEGDRYRPILQDPPGLEEHMRPGKEGQRAGRALRQYLSNVADRKSEEDYFAPQVFREGMRWLEEARGYKKFFLVLDSFDPHEPYDPPRWYADLYYPGYKGVDIIHPPLGSISWLKPTELKRIRALYAGEVTMFDVWLGRFLDKVGKMGLLDNTLIVFISDHGHPLGEHGIIKKLFSNLYYELLKIPLIIRHPKGVGAGKRIKAFVYNHDTFTTMLNFLKVKAPAQVDSLDLWPLVTGKRRKYRDYITSGFQRYSCALDRNWLFITGPPEKEDERLYNLKRDPQQKRNVAKRHPRVVALMKSRLREDSGGYVGGENS
jgi:arylsulfatase A-like enzyme